MKKSKSSILVLRYSNVFEEIQKDIPKSSYVTTKRLEEQLLWLLHWKYYPLSPEEFLNFILLRQEIPSKSYLTIFEGGYQNIYKYAFPVLKRYRISSIVFLSSGCIGGADNWNKSSNQILTIDNIEEMKKTRLFMFGSQGKTGQDLTKVSEELLDQEIINSKLVLEEVLNYPVRFFYYPNEKYNDNIRKKLFSSGIKLAFIDKEDKLTNLDDFDLIPSIKISEKDSFLRLLLRFRDIEKK